MISPSLANGVSPFNYSVKNTFVHLAEEEDLAMWRRQVSEPAAVFARQFSDAPYFAPTPLANVDCQECSEEEDDADAAEESEDCQEFPREWDSGGQATVMLSDIPREFTKDMLSDHLEAAGFGNTFDWLSVPLDKSGQFNAGYAMIVFTNESFAFKFNDIFSKTPFFKPSKEKEISGYSYRTYVDGQSWGGLAPALTVNTAYFPYSGCSPLISFCHHCRGSLLPSFRFCQLCGTKVEWT